MRGQFPPLVYVDQDDARLGRFPMSVDPYVEGQGRHTDKVYVIHLQSLERFLHRTKDMLSR